MRNNIKYNEFFCSPCDKEGAETPKKINDDSFAEYYKSEDEKYRKDAWQRLADHLGEDNRELFYALKDYYTVFDPKVAVWLAELYDPKIGGIYYSNSAKNTEGYAPDVESTAQGFSIIPRTGMAYLHGNAYKNVLPRDMLDEVGRYIKSLQEPNGFFYNYQWSKESHVTSRLSRDLSSSLGILGYCGMRPTYDAPTGERGDGIAVPLPNGVKRKEPDPEELTPQSPTIKATDNGKTHMEFLESCETMKAYLESLKETRGPLSWYYVGNTVNTLMRQVRARDLELREEFYSHPENKDKEFSGIRDTIIDFFNENQDPVSGHWEKEDGYLAVNAILKITGVYNQAEAEIHHSEKLVTAAFGAVLSSDEGITAVVDVYNPWSAVGGVISNIEKYGGEELVDGVLLSREERVERLRKFVKRSAVQAVYATKHKLSLFRKPDGSFSYTPMYSSPRSQRMPVAVPNSVEGDVNATELAINATTHTMFYTLGLGKYRVNVFGACELKLYLDTVERIRKNKG